MIDARSKRSLQSAGALFEPQEPELQKPLVDPRRKRMLRGPEAELADATYTISTAMTKLTQDRRFTDVLLSEADDHTSHRRDHRGLSETRAAITALVTLKIALR